MSADFSIPTTPSANVASASSTYAALARGASVTTAAILGHYAPDYDPEMRAKSNRTFRRIRDELGVEVAKAFGYEESPTEALEQRLREATLAKDWELVGRLAAELARQGRQVG